MVKADEKMSRDKDHTPWSSKHRHTAAQKKQVAQRKKRPSKRYIGEH